MMPGVSPSGFHTERGESGLRHRSRGLQGQPRSEPGAESDPCFWFPHISSSSDNSRVHHSAISRIKPTQAEFPKLHPLPGNCRAVQGQHLAYNSISIRTRFTATSHLVEQKENYTLPTALPPQRGAVERPPAWRLGAAPSQLWGSGAQSASRCSVVKQGSQSRPVLPVTRDCCKDRMPQSRVNASRACKRIARSKIKMFSQYRVCCPARTTDFKSK